MEFKSFKEFSQFINAQRKYDARKEQFKVDRAKTTVSFHDRLNKWCQTDKWVYYNDIYFTYDEENGLGGILILPNGRKIRGTTLCDFEQAVWDTYGVRRSGFEAR